MFKTFVFFLAVTVEHLNGYLGKKILTILLLQEYCTQLYVRADRLLMHDKLYTLNYLYIAFFPKRFSNGKSYFSTVLLFSASDEESYFKKLIKKERLQDPATIPCYGSSKIQQCSQSSEFFSVCNVDLYPSDFITSITLLTKCLQIFKYCSAEEACNCSPIL